MKAVSSIVLIQALRPLGTFNTGYELHHPTRAGAVKCPSHLGQRAVGVPEQQQQRPSGPDLTYSLAQYKCFEVSKGITRVVSEINDLKLRLENT
jgi:hypothetical protein